MLRETLERAARIGRGAKPESNLSADQSIKLAELRHDGFTSFDHLVGSPTLAALISSYKDKIERYLDFEFPLLAQSKVDPERDADLVASNFLATNEELKARDLTIERADCKSYRDTVAKFSPPTIKSFLPGDKLWWDVWLDSEVLPIITAYMGFVPQLQEAYVRRNFPSKFVVMNHAWHRDRNHKKHLLKSFLFLTDCTLETGPHHYIAGSVQDRRVDGKNYYTEDEVRSVYPQESGKEAVSVVPAGTLILEDTRGLHKAGIPQRGFRDLGFATFLPPIAALSRPPLYEMPRSVFAELSDEQAQFVPRQNISG